MLNKGKLVQEGKTCAEKCIEAQTAANGFKLNHSIFLPALTDGYMKNMSLEVAASA